MIPDNVEKIIMTKEDYDRNVEQLLLEKINAEQEIERLYKELKIKTDFIEKLLYLILNSTDNKLQKEVHKIGIKYDKNIQELKGDGSNE